MVDIFVVSDYCGNSEKKQKEKLEDEKSREEFSLMNDILLLVERLYLRIEEF
jgi:hypothetical protein